MLIIKIIKQRIVSASILLTGFICGWICACIILQHQFDLRESLKQKQFDDESNKWRENIKLLRKEIYGNNDFHRSDPSSKIGLRLAAYTPSKSSEYISLSYLGGLEDSKRILSLHGNGALYSENIGEKKLISMISPEQCKAFFYNILTSGILNYNDDIVDLKQSLLVPKMIKGVTDRPTTKISICIPEFLIDQTISVYAPDIQHDNFPDIIEYKIFNQIEKDILSMGSGKK